MMIEIAKLEMVLKSIVELCNKTTTGNVAHNMNTIKYQAEYAQEQIDKIKESENQLIINGD